MASVHLSQLRASSTMKTGSEVIPRQSRVFLGNGGARQLVGPLQSTTDFRTGENFNHLKLTAEKMLQEQACVKSDLHILNTKLQKSDEQVRTLESKLLDMNNENAMLKVTHKQDVKLWKGLDSKFLATTTFCDQLAETLQLLDSQVQEAERSKLSLEEKLAERMTFFEDTKSQLNDLLHRKEVAEDSMKQSEASNAKLHHTLQELEQNLVSESSKFQKLAAEKGDLQQQLTKALKTNEDDAAVIRSTRYEIHELQKDIITKAQEATSLQHLNLTLVQASRELELQVKDFQTLLATALKDKGALEEELEKLTLKINDLEKVKDSAAANIEELLAERAKWIQQAEEDKLSQGKVVNELKQHIVKSEMDSVFIKNQLQEAMKENERLVKVVAEQESRFASLRDEAKQLREEGTERCLVISRMSRDEESLRREIKEMEGHLADVENEAMECQKTFKLQLEAKQTELSRHLDEISHRNNEEMSHMRRKYEAGTREAIGEERLKGEAALEAVKQALEEAMAKELEAFNQRWKSVQEEHDLVISKLRESYEQEKAKTAALHADEVHKMQAELHTEKEKQNGNIAKVTEVQSKIEELQKSHQEEIGKFHQDYQKLLLKTTTAESSLKEEINKMQLAHEEELVRKTQEQKAECDRLEKDQQIHIQNLQKSMTRDIDEWKSKASLWENEWKDALKVAAKEVSKADKQTQFTSDDVMTNEVACKDIQTPLVTPVTKVAPRREPSTASASRNTLT